MLTRELHPRTVRKNRAEWHCRLAHDQRRACLFDPLVRGQRRIRYHVFANDVFKLPRIPPARWVTILEARGPGGAGTGFAHISNLFAHFSNLKVGGSRRKSLRRRISISYRRMAPSFGYLVVLTYSSAIGLLRPKLAAK
jgi:hypothetical protein